MDNKNRTFRRLVNGSVISTQCLGMQIFALLVAMSFLTASCGGGPDYIGPLNRDAGTAIVVDAGTTSVDAAPAPTGECVVDIDCDDGERFSLDTCVNASCVHEEVECFQDADCDDGDKSTVETCVGATCVYEDIVCNAGFVLDVVGKCVTVVAACPTIDDGDPCTVDGCAPRTGAVSHTPKACDDGNPNTDDSCDQATGDCLFVFDCGGNCSDDDACTVDTCDPLKGCVKEPLVCPTGYACSNGMCEQSCVLDADCNDGNWCTQQDSCDPTFGKCEYEERDCADADSTTVDICVSQAGNMGECQHFATACTDGCDDENECTLDLCQGGDECLHIAPPCGLGTAVNLATCQCDLVLVAVECTLDADCDDGNGCTEDECEANACTHPLLSCPAGSLCDSATGECKLLDKCPDGCDDGDPCTDDLCNKETGQCLPDTVPSCGEGNALNSATCQCEVVKECDDEGLVQCADFSIAGTVFSVHTVCSGGQQTVIEVCGPVVDKSAQCAIPDGCTDLP